MVKIVCYRITAFLMTALRRVVPLVPPAFWPPVVEPVSVWYVPGEFWLL